MTLGTVNHKVLLGQVGIAQVFKEVLGVGALGFRRPFTWSVVILLKLMC